MTSGQLLPRCSRCQAPVPAGHRVCNGCLRLIVLGADDRVVLVVSEKARA